MICRFARNTNGEKWFQGRLFATDHEGLCRNGLDCRASLTLSGFEGF
jgi:hypothetical protein